MILQQKRYSFDGEKVASSTATLPNATGLCGGVGYDSDAEVPAGYTRGYFDGVIDEFAGWTSALTAAQILAQYEAGAPSEYSGTGYDTITISAGNIDSTPLTFRCT